MWVSGQIFREERKAQRTFAFPKSSVSGGTIVSSSARMEPSGKLPQQHNVSTMLAACVAIFKLLSKMQGDSAHSSSSRYDR